MFTTEIVVILLLVGANAFLAMSELAVVSSRRSRLQQLVKRRHRGARVAMRLLENPTDFLSAIQVGITLITLLTGAYSGATLAEAFAVWLDRWPAIAPYGEAAAFVIVVLSVTYVQVVLGELLPKRIALNDPERFASALAPMMRGFAKGTAPLVWLLRSSTEGLLHLFGLKRDRALTVTGTRCGCWSPKALAPACSCRKSAR
jgi:putative hemolysin